MDGPVMTANSPAASTAVSSFASALSATTEWLAWEAAAHRLHTDPAAQRASAAYDGRLRELQLDLMLRSVSPENEAQLERLHDALFAEPSVVAYVAAETALKDLCRATADRLSEAIGLDYAGSCAPGCCS